MTKWDALSEQRNLLTALQIIADLLSTSELNMDDMEEETHNSVAEAQGFLRQAQKHAYNWSAAQQ